MTDIRRDERDEDRRERRTRRREHSTRRERNHDSSDRDIIQGPDVEELRRARDDFYTINGSSSRRTGMKVLKMPSASISRVSLSSAKSTSRHKHKSRHKHGSATDRSHGRRKSRSKDTRQKISTEEYVYEVGGERVTETRTTYIEKEEEDEDVEEEIMSDIQEEPEVNEKVKIVYLEKKKPRSSRHEERDRARIDSQERGASGRKLVVKSESPIKRSSSMLRNSSDMMVGLRRSHSQAPRSRPLSYSESNASVPNRRSSVFAGFFGSQPSHQPVKLTECIVCLADDIPSTKNAKLKCGHRICHSCLKRSFKLSITDPQHMPPRCCTSDHIPLHHVDNLFDISFKKTWNRKFQEYTTKNRIYCPGRRCGEWIKPANIHRDRDGKKYGVCSTCKTKVCCLCNGKWHGNRDCPKDQETNELLEVAKKAGWQRCFNCRTLVELKEGCNHMTCRCKAEFCMICGLKWKTCNCPWFNYEAVENDRLLHMQVPEDPFILPPHLRPRTYHEEIIDRRRQERDDEMLARRFQGLGIFDRGLDDDYNGGVGDVMGIGNAAGHFMNESFRRPGLGGGANYTARERRPSPSFGRNILHPRPPSPPPPRIRTRDMIDRYLPPEPEPMRREIIEEVIIPAPRRDRGSRTRDSSAAPNPRTPERSRSLAVREQEREMTPSDRSPGSSVLAGLNTRGSGGGTSRVNAWRAHVEPGVTPDEGVLSM